MGTKERWDKLKDIKTATAGCTLKSCCECAIQFDNQHCGIYAGDWDCYKDFDKIKGNVNAEVPVHSTRVRVGRSIDGFGLSPGITKDQRLGVESLLKSALSKLTGDLAGTYYPLTGMDEKV